MSNIKSMGWIKLMETLYQIRMIIGLSQDCTFSSASSSRASLVSTLLSCWAAKLHLAEAVLLKGAWLFQNLRSGFAYFLCHLQLIGSYVRTKGLFLSIICFMVSFPVFNRYHECYLVLHMKQIWYHCFSAFLVFLFVTKQVFARTQETPVVSVQWL